MKKGLFSKLIILFVIVANSLFTIAALYIFYKKGSEPITTITSWFGFTTVEVWTLGTIRKKKEENKNESN